MSAPKSGDAAIRYTENGQDYLHHLGHPLHRPVADISQVVHTWRSADLTTERRIAIGSGVHDLRAVIRWDGQTESLRRFLASARRGASLEYFPSLSNPSESYPCSLLDDSGAELDDDFWWDRRNALNVVLRRTDGGSWVGVTEGSLFYYTAGNDLPGLTFTRSGSVGPYTDEDGVLQSAAADVFRTEWLHDLDGLGLFNAPALLVEAARTNLISDDDITQWAINGSPVRTATDGPDGGASSAYTVEDNDGGTQEFVISPTIAASTFTGAEKASCVFVVRENTHPGTGGQDLLLRDVDASLARLQIIIDNWTDGEPDISGAATGTYLGKRYVGNGYWAIYGRTTTLTSTNEHVAWVRPAGIVSGQGSIDVYRVNVFDPDTPSRSILDASETRNVDTFFSGFAHRPQVLSAYVKLQAWGTAMRANLDSTAQTVLHIGAANLATDPRFQVQWGALGLAAVLHDNGVASVTEDAGSQPSFGDIVELRAVLLSDGSALIGVSVNGGAESTDTTSSAPDGGLVTEDGWGAGAERIYINPDSGCMDPILEVKVFPGNRSMDWLRAA